MYGTVSLIGDLRSTELLVRKPRPGEHECRTSDEAVAPIRMMATQWSDGDVAATLNRMGLPTNPGKNLDRAPCRLLAPSTRHPRV